MKVSVLAGGLRTTQVILSKKHVTSFWDELRDATASEKGNYKLPVGRSSIGNHLEEEFVVSKTDYWRGL
jgi:hypothetical protein